MDGVYAFDKLMVQTRKLAAEYYQATNQPLPVSGEIAKYDAARLLDLKKPSTEISGVDAVNDDGIQVQIKSRVIFKERYSNYRVGQINMDAEWNKVLLVLMKPDYYPFEIYVIDRAEIEDASESENPNRAKKGAMSVAKFIALGRLAWSEADGKLIESL